MNRQPEYNFFDAPLRVVLSGDKSAIIKVDAFYCANGLLLVGGWASEPLEFALEADGAELPLAASSSHCRKDVNDALKRNDNAPLAFAMAAVYGESPTNFNLLCRSVEMNMIFRLPLPLEKASASLNANAPVILGSDVYETCRILIKKREMLASFGNGKIEHAIRLNAPGYDSMMVISGWAALPPGGKLYAVNKGGNIKMPLEPYFWQRSDIEAGKGPCVNKSQAGHGFMASIPVFPPGEAFVEIWSEAQGKRIKLAGQLIDDARTFNNFLNYVFSIAVPWSNLAACYAKSLLPSLAIIHKQHHALLAQRPVMRGMVGQPPDSPIYSIIIPLFGNLKFLATQAMCFSEDEHIKEHAEIIYVLDDAGLMDEFSSMAVELHELFGVSLRWTGNGSNQGYSAANNLGASMAKGKYLVFMNSDVFPEKNGWLEEFGSALENNPEAGIAGCMMLSPSGTVQHAGMRFKYDSYFNIWINIHPHAGCDPDFVTETAEYVPAVTGACMAMKNKFFRQLGGWSQDYVLGDFEDSDLCMKASEKEKKIICLPDLRMTHLERQSFRLRGDEEMRQRLVVCNAIIHQEKWGKRIKDFSQAAGLDENTINSRCEESV